MPGTTPRLGTSTERDRLAAVLDVSDQLVSCQIEMIYQANKNQWVSLFLASDQ